MTDKADLFAQIRALRQSANNMNQKINQLEELVLKLADPYPVEKIQIQPDKGQDKDEWLTAKETCKALKISLPSFYRGIREGRLPDGFEFSARCKRWRLSDIEAWQEAKKHNPEGETIPQFVEVQKRTRGSKIKKYWELQRVSV